MYETQKVIFERLNDGSGRNNPAAPTSIYNEPEAANWEREDAMAYRNYFMVRTGSFSHIGTDHESAVAYCNKQAA